MGTLACAWLQYTYKFTLPSTLRPTILGMLLGMLCKSSSRLARQFDMLQLNFRDIQIGNYEVRYLRLRRSLTTHAGGIIG